MADAAVAEQKTAAPAGALGSAGRKKIANEIPLTGCLLYQFPSPRD